MLVLFREVRHYGARFLEGFEMSSGTVRTVRRCDAARLALSAPFFPREIYDRELTKAQL